MSDRSDSPSAPPPATAPSPTAHAPRSQTTFLSDPVVSKAWRQQRGQLGVLFIASRLLVWIVAGLSLHWVAPGPYFTPVNHWWDWLLRWDAHWYLDVAGHGYHFTQDGDPSNVVFLPLFPGLVRLVSLGGLIPLVLAGYFVAHGVLWLCGVALWRVVYREWQDAQVARLAVAFLFLGPVSVFFSSVYSEGLFLLLTIGCLGFARDQRWWWAGALGALAAATRFVGVVLIIPLVWEVWNARREVMPATPAPGAPSRWSPWLAVLLPGAGLGGFGLLMWAEFGDPLMYFRGQMYWDRHLAPFWILFARQSFWGLSGFHQVWFATAVAAAFSLLLLTVRYRFPPVYAIHGLTLGFIYISSRYAEAMPRYFSVVFPLYIVLGVVGRRHPALVWPLLIASTALLAQSVVLFVNGYWFT